MAQTTSSDLTQHANPVANAHHRKIELQSHGDLTYLQRNLAKAAREKLDLHFPLSAKQAAPAEVITLGGAPQSTEAEKASQTGEAGEQDEEDPLRRHVRQLIDQFLRQTYTTAASSISVNGIDASALPASILPSCSNPTPDPDPEAIAPLDPSQEIEGIHYTYSAFDPRLQKRLASLHGELESLTAQVSKLRREAPKSSADAYTAQLEAAIARDEEEWNKEQMRLQNQTQTGLELDPTRDGWNEDVRDVYERGVSSLAVLSGVSQGHEGNRDVKSLTETVGKVQRARNVAGEFE